MAPALSQMLPNNLPVGLGGLGGAPGMGALPGLFPPQAADSQVQQQIAQFMLQQRLLLEQRLRQNQLQAQAAMLQAKLQKRLTKIQDMLKETPDSDDDQES